MTRLHPFDYVFESLAGEAFPLIESEMPGPGVDLATFARLDSVRQLLDTLGDPTQSEPDATAVEGQLLLLLVAFRYWHAGRITVAVARDPLERLVDAPPTGRPPSPDVAWYLEFPERWFWARIDDQNPHEPLEGLFVSPTGRGEGLLIVAILGLRPDRHGFSQFTAAATWDEIAAAATCMRDPPFAPVVEGGASAGFRSLVSEAELLHLTQLALHSVAG